MKLKYTFAILAASTLGAQAVTIFSDDFESYPVSGSGNPADFSGTGNWSHNGAIGGARPNEIFFSAPNYGGTALWIADGTSALLGTGLNSRGITQGGDGLLANTAYTFSAAVVLETSVGSRNHDFTVDILAGTSLGTAASLIGGPQTFTARGDDDGTDPNNIDNSYDDQRTNINFNTGALGGSDELFMQITFTATSSGSGAFVGIDEVSIVDVVPEPSSAALLGLGGLALILLRRK